MIFSEKSIEGILSGRKTQTRRLVKEGEWGATDYYDSYGADCDFVLSPLDEKEKVNFVIKSPKKSRNRIKWQVGKDYSVQPGRGKGIDYCTKCKSSFMEVIPTTKNGKRVGCWCMYMDYWKPLRVVVKSIRKEKLLSVSEEDSKKEGYKDVHEFVKDFYLVNLAHLPKKFRIGKKVCVQFWNPEVWVLEFSLLGAKD